MFKKSIIVAVLFCISHSVAAESVYLKCSVKSPSGQVQKFSVKLDEASGKVTHTGGKGSGFNAEGFFSANEITYKNVTVSDLIFTYQYQINRTTLNVVKTFEAKVADPKFAATIPAEVVQSAGTCDIEVVNKRKI